MFADKQKSYVSTYTLQGKNWMNNTHIGPSKQRVLFHTSFSRRWPQTFCCVAYLCLRL